MFLLYWINVDKRKFGIFKKIDLHLDQSAAQIYAGMKRVFHIYLIDGELEQGSDLQPPNKGLGDGTQLEGMGLNEA